MKHKLDEKTTEYLEALLNMGVQVAELQYDDVSQQGMYAIIEHIADEFGIQKLYLEETVTEDGNITVELHEEDLTQNTDTPSSDDTVH